MQQINFYVASVLNSLTIIIACSIMFGWYFEYYPVPEAKMLMFNTSLGFFTVSLGIYALLYSYRKVSIVLAILLFVFSGVSLLQNMFPINLYVDTLFFYHESLAESQYTGRMPPNTSLSFILAGVILAWCNKKHWTLTQTTVCMQLSLLLLFASILFHLGYLTLFESKAMAIYTAIAFAILSCTFLSAINYFCVIHKIKLERTPPFALALGIFLINVLFVLSLRDQLITNGNQSYLTYLLFIVGSAFAILFGLVLFYAQKSVYNSNREKQLSNLLHETLESTVDGIFAAGPHGEILLYNQRFLDMWNLSESHCHKLNLFQVIDTISEQLDNPKSFKESIFHTFTDFSSPHHETLASLKEDGFYQVSVRIQIVHDQVVGYVLTVTDITASKKLEQEILHHKTYDALTGLANKMAIAQGMQLLIRQTLTREKLVPVILLDIGRFSRINDTYGQYIGDLLLKNIAQRLQERVPEAELIGRIVSDVFVIVFVINHINELETKTNQLIAIFDEPFYCQNTTLNLTCSLGVSIAPYDSKKPEELIRLADIAMLRSKKIGANHYMRYKPQYGEHVKELLQIENELYTALKKEQFILFYQPIIELSTFKIVGVEALLRWYNPRLGLLLPDQFLEVATEIGMISDIGEWVFTEACTQVREWEKQGLETIKLNVNVSSDQFKNCRVVADVMKVLKQTKLHPHQLQIELLEQSLIDQSEDIVYCLSSLQKKGVQVVLDDFGTGYSNVNYLKHFPVDCIKIALPFIMDIEKNVESRSLITTIIQMAQSHHIATVAEGIETKEQLDFLRAEKCQYGQGYYFSKPMSAEECYKFLSMKIYRPTD
ncbi:EAL domain-containing protein [Legionella yabuuchiae]|uniref:EAL domain-containing protein n=1 Tax=Legionella yabuuchiae TaxID=376727 RepID=UPI0010558804|nr:EAL domain-containing protein [Legionella yabuuchiae]